MTLPHSYAAALLLTILSMICWGSWANMQKLAGKWRFELYYFDYTFGLMLTAIVAAFTFGSLGFDGFLFMDDIARAGRRHMAYGVGAGVIFNLANMLLVGAIAVAGMSVAFPVVAGLAMVIGVVGNYVVNQQGNPSLLFLGVGVVLAAIVLDAVAYGVHSLKQSGKEIKAGKTNSTRPKVNWRGLILAVVSGVLMGSFYPLIEMSRQGDDGLGPYAISFLFAFGIFASTFVYNLFFMNLPVQGEPVEIPEYFRGTVKQHLLGLAGGVIWATGTYASFVVASAPDARLSPAISFGFGQGAALIAALWGLLLWKEFRGAVPKVRLYLGLMIALFAIGLTLISLAVA
ncbi:MAG: multidrug DMT transporter permease [bacterium]|jgi:glucose uptake protein